MIRAGRIALLLAAAGAGLLVVAMPATAATSMPQHPLGNFTVNHYDGLHLYADHLIDQSVVDAAEIPTLQAKSAVDSDHNGTITPPERGAYAAARCSTLASSLSLRVGGAPRPMTVQSSTFAYYPGAVGLQTSRLVCDLVASTPLRRETTLSFSDDFDGQGVGWHEVTATATGVALMNSPLPATSISDELRHYPNDLLASPLNVRGGDLSVRPGAGSTYSGSFHVSGTNVFARALNHVNTTFNGLVGRQRLTVGVGAVAVLLAMLLGAGHALLPGHGKTIMAAYLVGRRGRLRDVAAVGTTVTVTHTAGVLLLGLLISASSTFAPASAEKWLGVSSGLLVVGVGLGLVRSAMHRRRSGRSTGALLGDALEHGTLDQPAHQHDHASTHGHHHHHAPAGSERQHTHDVGAVAVLAVATVPSAPSHSHVHDHVHAAPAGSVHEHGPQETPHSHRHGLFGGHVHTPTDKPLSRASIVGLGVAGGLVPSPSALVVLLGTIALGRTVFGVLLVLSYGFGLALTLTLAGLLLVPLRNRAERLRLGRGVRGLAPYLDALPLITAGLVVVVGALLAVRSLSMF